MKICIQTEISYKLASGLEARVIYSSEGNFGFAADVTLLPRRSGPPGVDTGEGAWDETQSGALGFRDIRV